jgi:O-antigen/teichoic acid export membrane protein
MGFITAMVKYSAEKDDLTRQRAIISTAYILVLIFLSGSSLLYLLFSSQIQAVAAISKEIYLYSVILGLLYVLFTLTFNTLRGLLKMKNYSVIRPLYGIILLLSFLIFITIGYHSLESMILPLYLAYAITSLIILGLFGRKYIRFHFDIVWAKKMFHYSNYAMIGGIAFIIFSNIDKILIDRYMTIGDVGVYGAYYWAFLTFSTLFSNIFVTVLFPVASTYENKTEIYSRLNKIVPVLTILAFPSIIVFGFVIITFYGTEYPFNLSLALLFGIAAIVIFVDGVYVWLMNAVGNRGVKVSSFAAVTLAVINVTLNFILIPLMGLYGAITAKIIAYIISLSIVLSKRRYFFNEVE